MKIFVVSGYSQSLVLFRGCLIQSMVAKGHQVFALAGDKNESVRQWLSDEQSQFLTYYLNRTGLNPFKDIITFVHIYLHLLRNKPDLFFAYTAKPVIWGALAARLARTKQIHVMVTGLGNQLQTDGNKPTGLKSVLVCWLYKQAFKGCSSVIFQNNDDKQLLLDAGVMPANKARVVNGSGVDLTDYPKKPLPGGSPVFLCIARFLVAKGIREYAAAAKIVKKTYPDATFQLVGMPEAGENAIPLTEIEALHNEGIIEHIGRVENSVEVLSRCHIFVLASFYGEGLPRTILEAMSIGRPVLTTNNVGCREAVEDGVSGKIVAVKSVDALVAGINWFLDNRNQWDQMAEQGRSIIERKYDVRIVNEDMFTILGL